MIGPKPAHGISKRRTGPYHLPESDVDSTSRLPNPTLEMTPMDAARGEAKFINRELSWLEFNQRVLDEARNEDLPLLERLKFLAITASNLDEFFMVRVGGLQMLSEQGSRRQDPSGLTPEEELQAIGQRVHAMADHQNACYLEELEPALAEQGVKRLRPADLTERQARFLEQLFDNEIYPVLSPMAVFGAEDFPLLINQTLTIGAQLAPDSKDDEQPRFALIPFGRSTRRFITLPAEGGYAFIMLEDVVGLFIGRFFPGEEVVDHAPFRITRNADLGVREDQASDLLVQMEKVLDERKRSDCVRLEISETAGSTLHAFLKETLDVRDDHVYTLPGPLDLSAFMGLTDLQGFEYLKDAPWPPQASPAVPAGRSIFDVLSERDVLLYHPYESFEPVVRLVEEAADDPDVLAVKQTLYRTSRDSPIVAALQRAAERGKYVTAIVELKARFDEARNIEWARNLEKSGVQVIYGVKGLKTHAKVCIVVRREPHGIQRYVHFGTGNYNETTARLYSDGSLMTIDEELGADATSFFNAVTGYSQPQNFHKLEAAPIGLREKLLEMIRTETEQARRGQQARIVAKMNSLVDPSIIDALYEASQAGVETRLNVRGTCCLRPGVPNLSENIHVISIVDRFLEHARVFRFYHGGDDWIFLSSADWMPRNLDRRVELMVPVENPEARGRLIEILNTYFRDTVKARRLLPDGRYEKVTPRGKNQPLRSQEVLYRRACEAVKKVEQARPTIFEPHRAPAEEG